MIYYACANGKFETVKFLVENGAKLDIFDHENTTPLWWCCFKRQASFEMIVWILEQTNNYGLDIRHIKSQKSPYDVALP